MTDPRRLLRLVAGVVLFGIGIGLMARADLGLAAWDVLHQGLARRTGLTMGTASITTSATVLLLWWPLRERPGIGTVVNALGIGLVLDLTLWLVPLPEGLVARWGLMLAGPVLVGVGSGLYIGAGLGAGPRDGVMTGLARRGVPVGVARAGLELTVLAVGWLLGGTVGVGTVVFSLAIGPLVAFFLPRLAVDDRYLHDRRVTPAVDGARLS